MTSFYLARVGCHPIGVL